MDLPGGREPGDDVLQPAKERAGDDRVIGDDETEAAGLGDLRFEIVVALFVGVVFPMSLSNASSGMPGAGGLWAASSRSS